MKVEEVIDMYEKETIKTDYSIKNRKFKGMEILNKYVDELEFAAAHDIIYVADFEIVEKMSDEDIKELLKYGFFESEDSWAFFT